MRCKTVCSAIYWWFQEREEEEKNKKKKKKEQPEKMWIDPTMNNYYCAI